jgi:hypothetical protein
VKHGPKIGLLICLLSGALMVALISAGCNALRWGSEASETVYQETRPLALLNKYRYFKKVAASLDSMQANIKTMDATQKTWEKRYANVPVEKWPMRVQEQYDQRLQELNALKANFNDLAATYNRAMSDLSWAFCNAGKMPAGFPSDATALKRSYAEYILE